ncbi:CsbD family protein [Jongsikchunia kroppenstedtii]|uniref:CsbD family protein n=1 Tax=Jongsikchunia kroppenstedtii TaxID=1121721 RepID=UPI000371CE75|nr:CsbD family protein [Jongsikchunia kroppenstedtii]
MAISDDAQNKAEDLAGRAKEAAGAVTGDDDLKNEGKGDQAEADVKQKVADAADKVKEGVDTVKDKLTGN